MIDTIELLTDQGIIWKLTDISISDIDFGLGFLYGGMFILNKIPATLRPRFITYDNINRAFTFGEVYFSVLDIANVYGGNIPNIKIPATLRPRFITYDNINRAFTFGEVYFSILDIANVYGGNIPNINVPLDEITKYVNDELYETAEYGKNHPEYNPYLVTLRDPFDENKATLFTIESPTFFQGLFTILNAAEISYEKVILHKPIRGGIAYNISGVNLPRLEDL